MLCGLFQQRLSGQLLFSLYLRLASGPDGSPGPLVHLSGQPHSPVIHLVQQGGIALDLVGNASADVQVVVAQTLPQSDAAVFAHFLAQFFGAEFGNASQQISGIQIYGRSQDCRRLLDGDSQVPAHACGLAAAQELSEEILEPARLLAAVDVRHQVDEVFAGSGAQGIVQRLLDAHGLDLVALTLLGLPVVVPFHGVNQR